MLQRDSPPRTRARDARDHRAKMLARCSRAEFSSVLEYSSRRRHVPGRPVFAVHGSPSTQRPDGKKMKTYSYCNS